MTCNGTAFRINILTSTQVHKHPSESCMILVFARHWQKNFGLGSLTAMMIPYSIRMLITDVILVVAWAFLGFDLGPGAPMAYTLPG